MMRRSKIWLALLLAASMFVCIGCGGDKEGSAKTTGSKTAGKTAGTAQPSEEPVPAGEAASSHAQAEEDTEVLPDSAGAEEEAAIRSDIAASLPFAAGDDKVCAVVYLGRGKEQQQQQLEGFFATYMPEYTKEQIAALPRVDAGGEEAYLIVPRYEACELSVNFLQRQGDGTVEVTMDAEKPDGTFVLSCNPAQDFSNAEVNIAYQAKVHVIMPHISSYDNRLEPMQVALDLTDASVY